MKRGFSNDIHEILYYIYKGAKCEIISFELHTKCEIGRNNNTTTTATTKKEFKLMFKSALITWYSTYFGIHHFKSCYVYVSSIQEWKIYIRSKNSIINEDDIVPLRIQFVTYCLFKLTMAHPNTQVLQMSISTNIKMRVSMATNVENKIKNTFLWFEKKKNYFHIEMPHSLCYLMLIFVHSAIVVVIVTM